MKENKHHPANNQTKKIKRLRVLISAYACEPGKGSEPGVGWNFSTEMAKHHDVWVLTRKNNRKAIEEEVSHNPIERLHLIYHALPKWARWWKKRGRGVQIYYYLWQLTAISKVRKRHNVIGFDLSHHVTFVKYWAPSCLAWLKIPFIWGPVGGGEFTPKGLLSSLEIRGRIFEFVKLIAARGGEWDPFVRRIAKKATVVFASTKDTAQRLNCMGLKNVQVQTQIGMNEDEVELKSSSNAGCIFISIGRMIHWKGFMLGLKAFSRLNEKTSQYWFIGDGPCEHQLKKYVQENGLKQRVHFFGSISHAEVQKKLSKADVLLHPSYHDSAGLVCLEAMALGKPVICLDTGGPAFLIDQSSGIKCSIESESAAIDSIQRGMELLQNNNNFLMRLSKSSVDRVKSNFLWKTKVENFSDIYNEVNNEYRGINN